MDVGVGVGEATWFKRGSSGRLLFWVEKPWGLEMRGRVGGGVVRGIEDEERRGIAYIVRVGNMNGNRSGDFCYW